MSLVDPSTPSCVLANGQFVPGKFPCTLHDFLVAQQFLPRSVVVEHNGEAVAPSEFISRLLQTGDRLEIVRIVAGG
jgi:thiamine biosynthesis protein ThiS